MYEGSESIIYIHLYTILEILSRGKCKAWEFFTPFNLFGEPLPLIGLELVFWATIAFAEAFVIASVFEWK
jgi:hypothetical protein